MRALLLSEYMKLSVVERRDSRVHRPARSCLHGHSDFRAQVLATEYGASA